MPLDFSQDFNANGIWQVNRREQPFGPSPHGRSRVTQSLPGAMTPTRRKVFEIVDARSSFSP
jgi:hypothetical protein